MSISIGAEASVAQPSEAPLEDIESEMEIEGEAESEGEFDLSMMDDMLINPHAEDEREKQSNDDEEEEEDHVEEAGEENSNNHNKKDALKVVYGFDGNIYKINSDGSLVLLADAMMTYNVNSMNPI